MKENGLSARLPKRVVAVTTDSGHAPPVAPNVLNRQFAAERANTR